MTKKTLRKNKFSLFWTHYTNINEINDRPKCINQNNKTSRRKYKTLGLSFWG